jgi:hypothetical protein
VEQWRNKFSETGPTGIGRTNTQRKLLPDKQRVDKMSDDSERNTTECGRRDARGE